MDMMVVLELIVYSYQEVLLIALLLSFTHYLGDLVFDIVTIGI